MSFSGRLALCFSYISDYMMSEIGFAHWFSLYVCLCDLTVSSAFLEAAHGLESCLCQLDV